MRPMTRHYRVIFDVVVEAEDEDDAIGEAKSLISENMIGPVSIEEEPVS